MLRLKGTIYMHHITRSNQLCNDSHAYVVRKFTKDPITKRNETKRNETKERKWIGRTGDSTHWRCIFERSRVRKQWNKRQINFFEFYSQKWVEFFWVFHLEWNFIQRNKNKNSNISQNNAAIDTKFWYNINQKLFHHMLKLHIHRNITFCNIRIFVFVPSNNFLFHFSKLTHFCACTCIFDISFDVCFISCLFSACQIQR